VVFLVLISKVLPSDEKEGEGLPSSLELEEAAGAVKDLEVEEQEIEDELFRAALNKYPLSDESEIVKELSKQFGINLTESKKMAEKFPEEYVVDDKNISSVVKDLRKYRRTLKGDEKENLTKGIESLITAYSTYLDDCIKSIYWLDKYQIPLKQMKYNEKDLRKLHSVKDYRRRSEVVDILCKCWEVSLDLKNTTYSSEFSRLSKCRTTERRNFRKFLKNIPYQSIRKNLTEQLQDHILESVKNRPGISAREMHETMPSKLYRRSSPQIISKSAYKIGITNIDGQYFKITNLRKSLYSYTAAFIDSDGYITMDTKNNPRVGLVATGNRGKAFMVELQKSLGIGRLHLDQKSPQNTRKVNRLNFYSQGDIHELLTKCRDHFRMKGPQADLLLELIRIKKNHKDKDWSKERMDEIFKLMKWNNHQDNDDYDYSKYNIDIENISKYEGNSKMDIMDELESVGVVV
jgi:hypothetical protein